MSLMNRTKSLAKIIQGTAGEGLTQYDIVYSDPADSGKYKKASKDVAASAEAFGICLATVLDDALVEIVIGPGLVTNLNWDLTPGAILYVSGTPGAMTETLPVSGYIKPLGYAITTTQILFNPFNSWIVDNSVTLAKLDHGTQGDVLVYTTAGEPIRLGHGDAGQALVSGGHGADAAWGNVAGYITVTGTAGEALSQYDIVYTDTTDSGKYKKADKDVLVTADAVGIVTQTGGISNGATGEITLGERLITTGTWTPGGTIYLSGTAGGITQDLPTSGYIKPLGIATETNQILFKPETGWSASDGLANLDGDKVVIDWNPTNSTPTTVTETDTVDQLSSHLKGIDTSLATKVVVANHLGGTAALPQVIGVEETSGPTSLLMGAVSDGQQLKRSGTSIIGTAPMDVVGGRLDLVSATSIKWGFQDSSQIRLYNPTSSCWEVCNITTEPTLSNTATDLNSTALAPNTIYDIFAEYSSSTAFTLVASRWATGGDGANNSETQVCTTTATADTTGSQIVTYTSKNGSGYEGWYAFNRADGANNSSLLWVSSAAPSSGSPQSLMIDLGRSVCINKYRLKARVSDAVPGTNERAFPKTWKFQGTNNTSAVVTDAINDNGWVDLDTVASASDPVNNTYETLYHTFANTTRYRYYRLRITDRSGANNYCCIGEVDLVASIPAPGASSRVKVYSATEIYNAGDRVTYGGHDWVCILQTTAGTTPVAGSYWVDNGAKVGGHGDYNTGTAYATPIMTGNTAPNGTAFSDTTWDGSGTFDPYQAFKQSVNSSGWVSANTSVPHYVGYDFGVGVAKVINKYVIRARDSADSGVFFPASFTLQGSNNGTDYTTLDTRTGITYPGQATWTSTFTFSNTVAYRYYKLNVTALVTGSTATSIGELKLIEPANDFSGLYRHDGVLVSDSSATGKKRRWLGVIYTYNNAGVVNFKDDQNWRYISNFYNRTTKPVKSYNTNLFWTYDTTVWREAYNGSGQVRGNFITCMATNRQIGCSVFWTASATASSGGVHINASNNATLNIPCGTNSTTSNCSYKVIPISLGYNWITMVEYSAATKTYFSDSGMYGWADLDMEG